MSAACTLPSKPFGVRAAVDFGRRADLLEVAV
jgi:hypothetical protein